MIVEGKKTYTFGRNSTVNAKDNSMKVVYDRMIENMRLLMAKYDLYPTDVAVLIGMSKRTFSARRKAPWTFTFGEVELVAHVLRTDAATLMFGEVVPVDMSGLTANA